MSHKNVNAGVPKTLSHHRIRWVISPGQFAAEVGVILQSVLDTEITPELVPATDGEDIQSSEATVGPYALQDFTLFYVLRCGFRPSKIAFLAWHAWREAYSLAEMKGWLTVFAQRFYSFSQFKRSAMPNGPKVSHGGSLSPRGDWRAPSDSEAEVWLQELRENVPD